MFNLNSAEQMLQSAFRPRVSIPPLLLSRPFQCFVRRVRRVTARAEPVERLAVLVQLLGDQTSFTRPEHAEEGVLLAAWAADEARSWRAAGWDDDEILHVAATLVAGVVVRRAPAG